MSDEHEGGPGFAKLFEDIFTHPRTEGMSLAARGVYMRALACGNYYGLLTTTPQMLAADLACTEEEAQGGVDELVQRGCTMWWPRRSRLWLIDMASRHCYNPGMWTGLAKVALREAPEIRAAIVQRYGDTFRTTKWQKKPHTIAHAFPELRCETVDLKQEREDVRGTVSDTVSDTVSAAPLSLSSEVEDLARWALKGGDPEGLGPWPRARTPAGIEIPAPIVDRERMARWVSDEKHSAHEVHRTIVVLGRMVGEGAFPPGEYNSGRIFSGHLSDLIPKAAEWAAAQQRKAEEEEQAAMRRPAELSAEDRAKLVF